MTQKKTKKPIEAEEENVEEIDEEVEAVKSVTPCPFGKGATPQTQEDKPVRPGRGTRTKGMNPSLERAIIRRKEIAEERKKKMEAEKTLKSQLKEVEEERLRVAFELLENEKAKLAKMRETALTRQTPCPFEKGAIPQTRKKKVKKVIVEESDSESSEEEVVVRKPKTKTKVIVENPVAQLTHSAIREDLKKIQMDMLYKSLWGTG